MPDGTQSAVSSWKARHKRNIAISDAIVLLLAVVVAWLVRFGIGSEPDVVTGAGGLSHQVIGPVLALLWWAALSIYPSRDPDAGLSWGREAAIMLRGTAAVFGLVAVVLVIFRVEISRSFMALALGFGFGLLLISRRIWRSQVEKRRRSGELQSLVVVVGTVRSARRIARWFYADPSCPYRVTGVHAVGQEHDEETLLWRTPEDRWPPIPLMGSLRSLDEVLAVSGADTVIVSDSEQLGPDGLNDLVWHLDAKGVNLMVSPNVVGVSQPRLELRDVSGVPFVNVAKPRYDGSGLWAKTAFDYIAASVLVLLMSPVLAFSAIAIKVADRGPVFDRARRVGHGGREFTMLRFRTLPVGEVDRQTELGMARIIDGEGPKPTKIGRILRRYSLDEVPQLFNVLRGDMSLVGPRPIAPEQVATDPDRVARRLLVKQGITGLWQISARSDMTWDEATRLDLEYVENWSVSRDIAVLWRTASTVRTRAKLTDQVAALQAQIDEAAPLSKARLRVNSRGQVFLNDYPLFGGDTTLLLAEIDALLAKREPALMVTVNVDQILDLERSTRTLEVYEGADLLVMDGMPVVQLARMLGAGEVHRHTGADLLPLMAAESAERGWRVSVLGGGDGVAEAATTQLRATYPGSEVSAVDFPMMRDVYDEASLTVIEDLKATNPDVVFVCLGAPKQELWTLTWKDQLPPALYVGAGAAVDFAAERVSRAPVWLQRIGGEWLWRLAQEPKRMFGRYILKGPRFIKVIARSVRGRR